MRENSLAFVFIEVLYSQWHTLESASANQVPCHHAERPTRRRPWATGLKASSTLGLLSIEVESSTLQRASCMNTTHHLSSSSLDTSTSSRVALTAVTVRSTSLGLLPNLYLETNLLLETIHSGCYLVVLPCKRSLLLPFCLLPFLWGIAFVSLEYTSAYYLNDVMCKEDHTTNWAAMLEEVR